MVSTNRTLWDPLRNKQLLAEGAGFGRATFQSRAHGSSLARRRRRLTRRGMSSKSPRTTTAQRNGTRFVSRPRQSERRDEPTAAGTSPACGDPGSLAGRSAVRPHRRNRGDQGDQGGLTRTTAGGSWSAMRVPLVGEVQVPQQTAIPPLDEELFDAVAAQSPHDPAVVSFVRRFLRFAEADRKNARRQGPPPQDGEPLISERSEQDLLREMFELETSYRRAYYDQYSSAQGGPRPSR